MPRRKTRVYVCHFELSGYTGHMATAERRSPTSGGPLTNVEAAELIAIILANTSISATPRVQVPDSPRSLADYFPVALLQAA